MNILLIENESETRSLLTTFLEVRGHHVTEYEDAESGWTAYQNRYYPLIIVDCSMSGGDGIELCQNIRNAPGLQQGFILVLTARTKLGNFGQVLAAGADDYLEKPIDLPQLSVRLSMAEQRITAQKMAGQEQQFTDLVYGAIGKAVVITDSNNNIIMVNQAVAELSGYSADEVIGKNSNFLCSERYDETFNQLIWHKLNNTGIWEGEIWNRHKSGEEYAVWQLVHTIYDNNGNVLKRVAILSNITDKKRTEEKVRRQADYDLLTGLPNRRLFEDRLGLEIKKSNRANLTFALLFIDLDHFKEVNDTFGHAVGDRLLQKAAYRISACVRASDTVARLGGDEFTVILSEIPDIHHADNIAQKIVASLAEPYYFANKIINGSSSVGITLYPNDADSISTLLSNADQAMYVAKGKGRNQFSHFISTLNQDEQKRMHLINDLRRALASKQLKIYFQPIVRLSDGRIHKAEALLRWQHPVYGMISPVEFVPLAEDAGLINQIGDWVFKESADFAKRWSKQYSADFQVSVNISPIQFKDGHKDYAAEWPGYLQEIGLPGKNMAVEIFEGLMLDDEPNFINKLCMLREAGIQVAIDDFGTDYSSLAQHKEFNVEYLKINQPVILDFANDPNDLALSEAIVMAHKLGIKVIAEGVETEMQRELLVAAGCDYAQGNLYSSAVPPDELEGLLQCAVDEQVQADSSTLNETSAQALLKEQEVVDFLQPHMHGKSVKSWLIHDRQHDPIIPFILVRGEPCYLQSDLENFLKHTLNKSIRSFQTNQRYCTDRRDSHERRKNGKHKPIIGSSLQKGLKRRRRDDLGLHMHADTERSETIMLDRRDHTKQAVH